MDENGNLTEIVETKNIVKTADGAEADGVSVDVNSLVSMNMWGLTPGFLDGGTSFEWDGYENILKFVAVPTQYGQGLGHVTVSGGYSLTVPAPVSYTHLLLSGAMSSISMREKEIGSIK